MCVVLSYNCFEHINFRALKLNSKTLNLAAGKKIEFGFNLRNLSKFFLSRENGNQGKRKSFAVVHFHRLRFHFQRTPTFSFVQSVSQSISEARKEQKTSMR